jgi:hypothetical protein
VEAVTRLTSDSEIKAISGRLVTDGSRIYFGEGTEGSYRIMQAAATGGPAAIIPTRLANFQFTALSQDGSYLRGAAGDAFVLPLWAVPRPNGEPRLLGSVISQDGTFSLTGAFYSAWETTSMSPRKTGPNRANCSLSTVSRYSRAFLPAVSA